MSDSPSPSAPQQHRRAAPESIACAVLTVSDTRTLATDRSGELVVELLGGAGHKVAAREIVPDDPPQIERTLSPWIASGEVEAILVTGGTGISPRDQTVDTVERLLTRPIPGYGELLRMLSYEEIGPAAMLSRAVGGVAGQTVVLTMPGSSGGVRLAMERLVLPELGHLVYEAKK